MAMLENTLALHLPLPRGGGGDLLVPVVCWYMVSSWGGGGGGTLTIQLHVDLHASSV